MLIYNTTFMMLREREQEFLQWFGPRLSLLTAEGSGARGARLSSLCAVEGAELGANEAQSVAFQMEFDDEARLRLWAGGPMARVREDFMRKFGPDAATFSSVFRSIPLDSL